MRRTSLCAALLHTMSSHPVVVQQNYVIDNRKYQVMCTVQQHLFPKMSYQVAGARLRHAAVLNPFKCAAVIAVGVERVAERAAERARVRPVKRPPSSAIRVRVEWCHRVTQAAHLQQPKHLFLSWPVLRVGSQHNDIVECESTGVTRSHRPATCSPDTLATACLGAMLNTTPFLL